jgi:hypothetical protein
MYADTYVGYVVPLEFVMNPRNFQQDYFDLGLIYKLAKG